MKKILSLSTVWLLTFAWVSPVFAAAPDGNGPWADAVVSSSQANTKGGQPVSSVNPARSNPQAAVGPAENDTVDSHFFSLGFGGSITLRFDNPISNGVVNVEATNDGVGYPNETAMVELSADGTHWYSAGSISTDGTLAMPESLPCARYVRITDTSNPNNFFYDTDDAYDVDGVQAADGVSCELPAVPEFGLISGMVAMITSAGVFLKMKGVI